MGRLSSRDRKLAHLAGENVSTIENRNFALQAVSDAQTILRSPLPIAATPAFTLVAQTAYWVYMGYTQKTITVSNVTVVQSGTTAAGAQVAEFALASTPAAPNGALQTLTVAAVRANTQLDDFTGTVPAGGVVRGTVGTWWHAVDPAVHLWVGIRFAMATTQPTVVGTAHDLSTGSALITSALVNPIAQGGLYVGALLPQIISGAASAPLVHVKLVE